MHWLKKPATRTICSTGSLGAAHLPDDTDFRALVGKAAGLVGSVSVSAVQRLILGQIHQRDLNLAAIHIHHSPCGLGRHAQSAHPA